jgi:hypothetical protein
MKVKLVSVVCLMLSLSLQAQESRWHQGVKYDIQAALDDERHQLKAEFNIEYTNNSPQVLSYIIFHVWANAFSDKSSDFAQQMNRLGERDFYFADESRCGGYDSIAFYAGSQRLTTIQHEGKVDILRVILPEVLGPGQTIHIHGNYLLSIPEQFSRMGRQEGAYQLTQWYPKPAVFDQDGWHPMPYLHLGEYYSEFGSYNISLSLPGDYVVAHTGEILSFDERDSYDQMSERGTPYSAKAEKKTLSFKADSVHDFALFLDKRWLFRQKPVMLKDGSMVMAKAYYLPENAKKWEAGIDYVGRAVQFLSEKVGRYPYPHATAVDGLLIAGGGMEYPMVTIIGDVDSEATLDQVIAHEVFHNWFYGILASNERKHPWLDEGLTSYYENRYMETYYPLGDRNPVIPTNHSGLGMLHLGYAFEARRGMDYDPDSSSVSYDELGYGIAAYAKPMIALRNLESRFTQDSVDLAMQAFFNEYRMKHFVPSDLRRSLEQSLNNDLGWLFDGAMSTREVLDYGLKKAKYTDGKWSLSIKNYSPIPAPYTLSSSEGDRYRLDGHLGLRTIDVKGSEKVRNWQLHPERKSLDLYGQNDQIRTGGLAKTFEPLKIRWLPGITDREHTNLYISPVLGWNQYDHWMLGLHLNNQGFMPKRWSINLAPMFSFAESEVSGFGRIAYNHQYRTGIFHRSQVGIEAKSFNVRDVRDGDQSMRWSKLSPFVKLGWFGPREEQAYNEISLRAERLFRQEPVYRDLEYIGETEKNFDRWLMAYSFKKEGRLNPFRLNSDLEYGNYEISGLGEQQYLRWTVTYDQDLYYAEDKKFDVRLFGGAFLLNDRREAGSIANELAQRSLGLAYQGYIDFFDETFLGRFASQGLLARQVAIREGGFKTGFTASNANVIGNSNDWIASVNLSADLPFDFFLLKMIDPYLDVGYFSNRTPTGSRDFQDQLIWSGGLSLEFADGLIAFHLPLINSQNINDALDGVGQESIWERISFSIKFDPTNPFDFLETSRLSF